MAMLAPLPSLTKSLVLALIFSASINCHAAEPTNTALQIETKNSQLVIRPSVVTANDVVTISFPRQHPQKMAIKSPSGEWFVVHEKSEKIYLLPKHKFSNATAVQKKISGIKGVKWIDGKRVAGPVFNEPGEYLIYMADNLETEPENTFYMAGTVNYRQ